VSASRSSACASSRFLARARGARRESLEPVGLAVKFCQRQPRRLLAVHAVDRGVLGVAALGLRDEALQGVRRLGVRAVELGQLAVYVGV
jgi:hypothetical protein